MADAWQTLHFAKDGIVEALPLRRAGVTLPGQSDVNGESAFGGEALIHRNQTDQAGGEQPRNDQEQGTRANFETDERFPQTPGRATLGRGECTGF